MLSASTSGIFVQELSLLQILFVCHKDIFSILDERLLPTRQALQSKLSGTNCVYRGAPLVRTADSRRE